MGRWVSMAGREGGTVPAVVLSPGFSADHLAFAATNAGVFRSRDGGSTWEPPKSPLDAFSSQSIAISPTFGQDHTLFAGSADGGVYRSTDAGERWALWARLGQGSGVVALAVAREESGLTIAAATLGEGLFVSKTGREWKACNSGLPDLSIVALALSPDFPRDGIAFVATERGLHVTSDGCRSWKQVWSAGENDGVQCIAISPDFPVDGTVLVGTERQGVMMSTDGGSTWLPAGSGLPDSCVNSLVVSPDFRRDRTVIAGTGAGLAISTDSGHAWRAVAAETEMILGLAIASGEERVAIAGLVGGGVLRSPDGGIHWEIANTGLEASYLSGVVFSPDFETDGVLFAWGLSDGVLRSLDGGRSWQPSTAGIEGLTLSALAVSPSCPWNGVVQVATSSGIFRSTDRGESWKPLGLNDRTIGLMAISPLFAADPTMVATSGRDLFWSSDGGSEWNRLEPPADDESPVAAELAVGPEGGRTLLLATWREPTYYRRGRVRVWQRLLPGEGWKLVFTRDSDSRVVALAVPDSFREDGKFFIGNGEAVYHIAPDAQERTREGVRPIWLPSWVGTRSHPVVSLAAASRFSINHTLVAGGGDGVQISSDGGLRWQRVGDVPGGRPVVAVAASPGFPDGGRLFALSLGGRLWRWEEETS